MRIEIKRIDLISAGGFGALTVASAVIVAGAIALVAVGVSGELGPLTDLLEADRVDEDLEAGEAAGLLGVAAVMYLVVASMGAMVGGFLVGMFFAALYNVVAGIAGGVVLEMEPVPER
ncbi:MAG: hypothetical protein AAGC57_16050 [Pseudomonadota bacterium]